jgi:tetratricopeptide (TPR) repeat protein
LGGADLKVRVIVLTGPVLTDAFHGAAGYQYGRSSRECSALMAVPVPSPLSGASRFRRRMLAPTALVAIALCGCSINLGSLSSEPEHEAPKAAPVVGNDAPAHTARAEALARSGKTDEALAEFDQAITLDPHNAEALYNRGLLYQGEKQHQLAVDDFTAANGLTPQRPEPLLGRAISYLALDRPKEAAADLDEAAQADPQNPQIWTVRGQAYERLGDKTKAAASYSRAINLRPKDEAARSGFTRVGGKPGQTYETF